MLEPGLRSNSIDSVYNAHVVPADQNRRDAGLTDQPSEVTSFDVGEATICMPASTVVEALSAPTPSGFLKEAHQASASARVQRPSGSSRSSASARARVPG